MNRYLYSLIRSVQFSPESDAYGNITNETQVGKSPLGLDAQEAGQRANLNTAGKYQLYYDVNGSTPVVGGKLLLAGFIKETRDDIAITTKLIDTMWDHVNSAASPIPYTDYLTYDNTKLNDRRKYRNFFGAVTVVCVSMAEDITYIDGSLYNDSNTIDAMYYTNEVTGPHADKMVNRAVNASKDQFSPATRRIAKLAKTIKTAVLAQMNDTNPFYAMPLAEIYDRLVDYFKLINRAVVLVKNAEAWLHAGELLQTGAQQAFNDYRSIYNSKLVLEIHDYLGRLKSSLVGQYYDSIGLSNYIKYGTMGLNPTQNGSVRFVQPIVSNMAPTLDKVVTTGNTDYTGSLIFLPNTKVHAAMNEGKLAEYSDIIVQILDQTNNLLYTADVARMQTALAAFNGVPQLGTIEWTGYDVKRDLIALLSSSTSKIMGTLNVNSRVVMSANDISNNETFTINLETLTVPFSSQYKNAPDQTVPNPNYPVCPNGINRPSKLALGVVCNFNGVGEQHAAIPSGSKPYNGPKYTLDLLNNPYINQLTIERDILSPKDPYLPARLFALSYASVFSKRDIESSKFSGLYYEEMIKAGANIPVLTNGITRNDNNVFRTSFYIGRTDKTLASSTFSFWKALSVLHRGDCVINANINSQQLADLSDGVIGDVLLKNFSRGYSGNHTLLDDNKTKLAYDSTDLAWTTTIAATSTDEMNILNLASNNIFDLMPADTSYNSFGASGYPYVSFILGNNIGKVSGTEVIGVESTSQMVSPIHTALHAYCDHDAMDNACVDVLGWLPQSFCYAAIYQQQQKFSLESYVYVAPGGLQSINNLGIPEHTYYNASFDCNLGLAIYKNSLGADYSV